MNDHVNDTNRPAAERDDEGSGRKPDFIAYNVREGRDGKAFFNKVGAAWSHKDGQGYEVNLESLPVDGRVTLREIREERMRGQDDTGKREARASREPTQRRGRFR